MKRLLFAMIGILLLLSIVVILTMASNKKTNASAYQSPQNKEIAAWMWESHDSLNDNEVNILLKSAQEKKINTLYVSIDAYLDLYEDTNNSQRAEDLRTYTKSLNTFIKLAKEHKIKVQALAGSTEWANDSHVYIPPILLEFVLEYNKQNPEYAFAGMQFDIEFYNDDTFDDDKTDRALSYLRMMDALVIITQKEAGNTKKDFALGFAIPYWFDKGNEILPKIEYNSQEKPVGIHIMDILNNYDNSYIAVMAYRKTAQGENGTIALVKDEISYASESAKNVGVIVAQETANATGEEHISFYGETRQTFEKEVKKIFEAYDNENAFKGIAIHDINSFIDMR